MSELKLAITAMRTAAIEALSVVDADAHVSQKAIDQARSIVNEAADRLIVISNMDFGMPAAQLDQLDQIALDIRRKKRGARRLVDVLSTGEHIYVALAANDMKLAPGYTITEALARLGTDGVHDLVKRWQYRG